MFRMSYFLFKTDCLLPGLSTHLCPPWPLALPGWAATRGESGGGGAMDPGGGGGAAGRGGSRTTPGPGMGMRTTWGSTLGREENGMIGQ